MGAGSIDSFGEKFNQFLMKNVRQPVDKVFLALRTPRAFFRLGHADLGFNAYLVRPFSFKLDLR